MRAGAGCRVWKREGELDSLPGTSGIVVGKMHYRPVDQSVAQAKIFSPATEPDGS
jgi:hypothetical protein